MQTTPHMGLVVWNQTTDLFDHTELAADFKKIDSHDHSAGNGVPVGNAGLASGAVTLDKVAPSLLAYFVPTGAVLPYAGATAPAGFLMCDGVQYSTFIYNALYQTIGAHFGSAPTGFFLVPNLQQRFPLGKAPIGVASVMGTPGGSIEHTHSVPNMSIPGLPIPGLAIPRLSVSDVPIPSLTVNPHRHTLSGQGAVQLGVGTHSGNTALVGALSNGTGNFAGAQFYDNHAWGFDGSAELAQGFGLWGTTDEWVEFFGGTATTQADSTGSGQTGSGTTGGGTTGSSTTGTATTGPADPPYLVMNYIIKY